MSNLRSKFQRNRSNFFDHSLSQSLTHSLPRLRRGGQEGGVGVRERKLRQGKQTTSGVQTTSAVQTTSGVQTTASYGRR